MIKTKILAAAAWLMLFAGPVFGDTSLPNILFILVDDLGYGDLACYNPQSKIPTRNLDQLASQGMRFTDAHSPSTVCTPSRYSLMTGRMAFRTGYRGVFSGVAGPCLIEPNRLTLPGMLGDHGYETAMFGKWHIGMTFYDHDGRTIEKGNLEAVQQADFSRSIPDAPVRPFLIQQTWTLQMSVRSGDWKYLDHKGSGGNDYDRDSSEMKPFAILDTASNAPGQLYNLKTDPGETTNLYFEHPRIVSELKSILEESKRSGRSAPVRN